MPRSAIDLGSMEATREVVPFTHELNDSIAWLQSA